MRMLFVLFMATLLSACDTRFEHYSTISLADGSEFVVMRREPPDVPIAQFSFEIVPHGTKPASEGEFFHATGNTDSPKFVMIAAPKGNLFGIAADEDPNLLLVLCDLTAGTTIPHHYYPGIAPSSQNPEYVRLRNEYGASISQLLARLAEAVKNPDLRFYDNHSGTTIVAEQDEDDQAAAALESKR